MKQKNTQNGGSIGLIILIIVVVLLFFYFKGSNLVQYFWDTFTGNMQKISQSQETSWQTASPEAFFR